VAAVPPNQNELVSKPAAIIIHCCYINERAATHPSVHPGAFKQGKRGVGGPNRGVDAYPRLTGSKVDTRVMAAAMPPSTVAPATRE